MDLLQVRRYGQDRLCTPSIVSLWFGASGWHAERHLMGQRQRVRSGDCRGGCTGRHRRGQRRHHREVVDHAAPGNPIAKQRIPGASNCDDDDKSARIHDQRETCRLRQGASTWPCRPVRSSRRQAARQCGLARRDRVPDRDRQHHLGDRRLLRVRPHRPRRADSSCSEHRCRVRTWGAATSSWPTIAATLSLGIDAPLGVDTSVPVRIATVTGVTTYTDSSILTNGTTYHYLVRALDAAHQRRPRAPRSPTSCPTARRPGRRPASWPRRAVHTWTWAGTYLVDLADFSAVTVVRRWAPRPRTRPTAPRSTRAPGPGANDTGLANGNHRADHDAAFADDMAPTYAAAAAATQRRPRRDRSRASSRPPATGLSSAAGRSPPTWTSGLLQDRAQGGVGPDRTGRRRAGLRWLGHERLLMRLGQRHALLLRCLRHDAAGNDGTAATADATPNVGTTLTLDVPPAIVDRGQHWTLSGQLRDDGPPRGAGRRRRPTASSLPTAAPPGPRSTRVTPLSGTSMYDRIDSSGPPRRRSTASLRRELR